MKHRVGFNRLGRTSSHRKSLHRNMATSLFKHERITTTKAKATAVRRTAEKMITRAKVDSVHNRRVVGEDIKDKAVLAKLFTEIGPRFKDRAGGYTRMLKIGARQGDAAEVVILELVDRTVDDDKKKKETKKDEKKKKTDKAAAKTVESRAAAKSGKSAAREKPIESKVKPAESEEVVVDSVEKEADVDVKEENI